MLRVGIVGCGCIFTMHATSAHHLENAVIAGVCDIKKDRADAAAKKYGIIPIAGMELTTAEDIHIVCLFEELDTALAFGEEVENYRRLKKLILTPLAVEKQERMRLCFDGLERKLRENVSDEELAVFLAVAEVDLV